MTQIHNTTHYAVIAPPPTSNGDLHVGHLSGPYLACDIFNRYQKSTGIKSYYVTGTDDNQSYVITSSRKQNVAPEHLVSKSTRDIKNSLSMANIHADEFAPFDSGYKKACIEFISQLYKRSKFKKKNKAFYFCEKTRQFLTEAYIEGTCPQCNVNSKGGICESCGHPNNYTELVDPFSTLYPDSQITIKSVPILVFELEEYRQALRSYYDDKRDQMRPRLTKLMDELLSRPLPDLPITYPDQNVKKWGLSADFLGLTDQTINAWVEGMPSVMYATARAMSTHTKQLHWSDAWRADSKCKIVEFIGFDNSYFWGLTHVALIMAFEGLYKTPETIITNEFYEFEGKKFSTSQNHVIWAQELLSEYDSDLVRLHLSLTNPQYQRSNFSLDQMIEQTINPVNDQLSSIVQNFNTLYESSAFETDQFFDLTPTVYQRIKTYENRLHMFFSESNFSLRDAAETLLHMLTWIHNMTNSLNQKNSEKSTSELNDIASCWTALEYFARYAQPVIPDISKRVLDNLSPLDRSWIAISESFKPRPVPISDSVGFSTHFPKITHIHKKVA